MQSILSLPDSLSHLLLQTFLDKLCSPQVAPGAPGVSFLLSWTSVPCSAPCPDPCPRSLAALSQHLFSCSVLVCVLCRSPRSLLDPFPLDFIPR